MTENGKPKFLKGNSRWALAFALSSLRNYPVRNVGIALVLAVGVALPTTVFVWANTGTTLAVNDYFTENVYQMSLRPRTADLPNPTERDTIFEASLNHEYVEIAHKVVSTIGLLTGHGLPDWVFYDRYAINYFLGIKDCRTIFVTNAVLANWAARFDFRGNFSLQTGEVLVSEDFIDYARQVHGINIGLGSEIDITVVKHGQWGSDSPGHPNGGGLPIAGNLTVVGVYSIKSLTNQISEVFPSSTRQNWDPLGTPASVLGIDDSVMMLEEEVGAELLHEIDNRGYFGSAMLVRASQLSLIAAGVQRMGDNLLSFKTQIEEQFEGYRVDGFDDIRDLDAYVQTYLGSQVLTIVVFPVLIMSMMLTVFTSETSVSRRKGEISALRAKGASFNQVFSTFMWESLLLSIIGLILGIGLAFIMAPLIGSTSGLFIFDPTLYVAFITHLSVPPLALVIASAIAMYLPAAYLLHVARRIDVTEIGQPMTGLPSEGAEMPSVWGYAIGLGVVLTILLVMPNLVSPSGTLAVAEVLGSSLLLFAASYLGSRTMRLVTAKVSSETRFLLGEKSLYLSQSLRKRKGQFIPLLVILTLTLTTSMMMLIQSSSFEATLDNELRYSIGADMRVEVNDVPLTYNRTLLNYPGILQVTPILETWAQVGGHPFYLEGVRPLEYLEIGIFSSDSFVSESPESVLAALSNTSNGIVISEYYSNLWNRSVGGSVSAYYGTSNSSRLGVFEIVGVMRSAPGFGVASTVDLPGASFASQFGFQVGQGGFALVNLDYISEHSLIETVDLFLAETVEFADLASVVEELEEQRGVSVFTADSFDIATESFSIQLFLSGIQGLTTITFILCVAMGLSAIALFLGSAVMEREPEYAIFRAIGGTKRQVVMMVFGEFAGTVVAAIGISFILGIAFGYSMSILTFGISPFSPVLAEVLALPFSMMLVIIVLESAVLLASCYLPASRAGSVDPASALRNL
ncbi:MAG: FtsX-like permease family protein [Candidatus Thorarchaeota archaeon]|jgi:ABC-type lipoprotein release transport system permease subunit